MISMKRDHTRWILLASVMPMIVPNLFGQADLITLTEKTRPSVLLITTADRNGKPVAGGTGFLVSREGYLITNQHVIRKAASAVAKGDNGTTFHVEGILATDLQHDLAILKIDSRGAPVLPLGTSAQIKAGEKVAVIGSPLGLEGSLSEGIVAANRDLKQVGRILQITAPISHGSSGSPVLDLNGRVVGVAVGSRKEGQAVNFAIPVEDLARLMSGIRFNQPPISFSDRSINPPDRPNDSTAITSTVTAREPRELPPDMLDQIQLKLVSNEEGILKLEVHNDTNWALTKVMVSLHRWSQHGPGTLNHATRNVTLVPPIQTTGKPHSTSVFSAEVGDFLNDVATDYGRGPVIDPTYFKIAIVEAEGTGP
jgi:S1-C subfamily serine protease